MFTRDTLLIKGERVQLPTKYGYFELVPFKEKTNRTLFRYKTERNGTSTF